LTALEPQGPNAEQIRYWNETAGPKWVALQEMIDRHIRAFGDAAIDRAAPRPGERVVDVGCGCGQTSIELARRVAPGGSVTGIDLSAPMLERARTNARANGVDNATFENADAQTHTFSAPFDLLFSRFGVMFFADPPAAFTNLHRALRPDGRLVFVCWQNVQLNPWMFIPLMAAAQHIALPPPPAPDAPGPFAFADADRVKKILGDGGFRNVSLDSLPMTLAVGGATEIDSAVEFLIQLGPAAAALREAPDPSVQPRVVAALREALQPYYVAGEGVRMDASAWLVTAAA